VDEGFDFGLVGGGYDLAKNFLCFVCCGFFCGVLGPVFWNLSVFEVFLRDGGNELFEMSPVLVEILFGVEMGMVLNAYSHVGSPDNPLLVCSVFEVKNAPGASLMMWFLLGHDLLDVYGGGYGLMVCVKVLVWAIDGQALGPAGQVFVEPNKVNGG